MSDTEYSVETLSECLEEMKPLLVKHWEEIALHRDKIELSPNYERYYEAEALGLIHIVTARNEGRLVGYFISFIAPHMHYQEHSFAVNDILFIAPEYRGSGVGADMFSYAEAELKALGVSVVMIAMKTHSPFDELCKGLGYSNVERVYSKYIK